MAAVWTSWDGRCLRWRAAPGAALELCIDGIVFERFAAGDGAGERAFDYSPSGSTELEFSLRRRDDGALTAPAWRVHFGAAAPAGIDQWQGPPRVLQPFDVPLPALTTKPPQLTVVVPIHNATELVRRCLEAILRWTRATVELILIDDASTDAGIAPLLARYADRAQIVRNANNLGYTRSCNIGIALAGMADVVLLNSDTEVGPRWLERLWQTAYADASVGTVTAVSDNAGAFTVPELEQYCPIPERWSLAQAQRALLQHAGGCLPELPTGNGFCMYVKRALFDRVGVLDAAAFPAGYGEENDLCQRAEHVGLRHVIAGDVLVRHARSASFGAERRALLGAQGMAVLRRRYPDYEAKVGATLFGFARRVLDYRVRRIYADGDGFGVPRPRALLAQSAAQPESLPAFDCRLLEAGAPPDVGALRSRLARDAIEVIIATQTSTELREAAQSLGVPICTDSRAAALVAPEGVLP